MYINRTKASEQNQVWVGMSKETAHQLGTPISSLMAWSELLKNEHIDDSILNEINKDISRLENIAQRFSKIGSDPKLVDENINTVISEFVVYFKNRTSSKVSFIVNMPQQELHANISRHLFEWVLENLCKNAVDAMNGVGNITIDLFDNKKYIYIEISDTGKGIENKYQKDIFKPGFTTKERGWGLGLTLTQRIVNEYHKGKIELKNSVVGKGSTFKITLRKNN
ncbi:MAG: HAMP domain-containing histidine kinase [Bacteroidales bacterium]|nr:HAMP domain-containing histidine kinase [Bacteroidales bacterium]